MEKENIIRIGDLQMLFEICEEEFKSWTKLKNLIAAYESEGKELKPFNLGETYVPIEDYKFSKEINQGKFALNKHYTKAIIFLAIYLEAFIFDYAASRLGSNYVKKFLDKLDVVGKWKIIPKLITGENINATNIKYSYLPKIISRRNGLIHNKSKDLKTLIERVNTKQVENDELDLKSCFECLEYLLSEIYRIDPDFQPLVNNLNELRQIIKLS